MKKLMNRTLALLAFLLPLSGFAHPGHGETDGYSIIHYFVEPNHEIVVAAVLMVIGVYFFLLRKSKASQNKKA